MNLSLPQSVFDGIRAMASPAMAGISDVLEKINSLNAAKDVGAVLGSVGTDTAAQSAALLGISDKLTAGSLTPAAAVTQIAPIIASLRSQSASLAEKITSLQGGDPAALAAANSAKAALDGQINSLTSITTSSAASMVTALTSIRTSISSAVSTLNGVAAKIPKVDTAAAQAMVNSCMALANTGTGAALAMGATVSALKDSGKLNSVIEEVKKPTADVVAAIIYAKTPDASLNYSGTDYIVWDRMNNERIRRGMAGLSTARPAPR